MTDEAQQAPSTDAKVVYSYVDLELEERELKERLERVKAQKEQLTASVLEHFAQNGTDRFSAKGITVYIRREIWAAKQEGVEPEQIITALVNAGLPEYAPNRVNWQSLSAYVRELDQAGEPLPATLEGVIRKTEQFKVATRKAG